MVGSKIRCNTEIIEKQQSSNVQALEKRKLWSIGLSHRPAQRNTMILWHLVLLCILMSLFRDTAGTVCSEAVTDGSPVMNMCEDGNVIGKRVVIDTFGSSAYIVNNGSFNCSCTATLTGLPEGVTTTTVEYGFVQSLYPPPGCESSLNISAQLASFPGVHSNTYSCTMRKNNTVNLVQTNDTVTVLWQSGPSGSSSGYCLLVKAGLGSFSTKCNSRGTTLPTSPSSAPQTTTSKTPPPTSTTVMTSSRTTSTTTKATTTATTTTPPPPTTKTTTTTPHPSTTITSTVSGVTNGGEAISSSARTTTVKEDTTMADKIKEKKLDTTVIIAIAAGGVVFLVICIVIAVMCSRTKKKPNEHREPEISIAHNVLYEDTGVLPPEAVTNHVLTPSGEIYAQVNKNSKVQTKKSQEQPRGPEQEIEHVTTPSGDMYAQVEKHSKVKNTNSTNQSREPEQEIEHITMPSGDIYAQISKDANDESN